MLSMIVTVDRNWALSNAHRPLISIPDDIKFIKDTTYGQVVMMGKHTFENHFGSSPLANRITIICTKDENYKASGVTVVHSSTQAMLAAEKYNRDVYVLGGKRLYHDLLPLCDEVHVTAVDYSYTADAWFPNLDKRPEWVLVDESEEQTHFDVIYTFKRYLRRKDFMS